MDKTFTTQQLLASRKLTRVLGEVIGGQMRDYVATLAPLFRPRSIFGDHIQGSGKEPVKGADHAFKELQTLYEAVATHPPFNLPKDLQSPLMQMTASVQLSPVEYAYVTKTGSKNGKTITVTCPYQAVLSYSTYSPRRLQQLLAARNRNEAELEQFVLHYLAMQIVVAQQPGLSAVFATLHFPLRSGHLPGLGDLPITYVGSSISTSLPPETLVIESTDLSGNDAFEEIVNVEDIAKLTDPLKERLLQIARSSQDPAANTPQHSA